MPLPYATFKKDYPEKLYPTTGIGASSYFVKVGTCKSKINNKLTKDTITLYKN